MELTKEHFDTEMEKFGSRMTTMESDIKDIKEKVTRIDKRDIEDSNAFAKDIVQLQKDVKQLKLKPAV